MSITEYAAGTRLSCHSHANGATIDSGCHDRQGDPQRPRSAGWAATGTAGHHTGVAVRACWLLNGSRAAARSRRPA